MRLKINPVNPKTHEYVDESLPTVRIGYVYLHGVLETRNGYDIFGVVGNDFDWAPGIYPCEIVGTLNEYCTFYLWWNRHLHGLVVDNHDRESVEYAKECYENQVSSL